MLVPNLPHLIEAARQATPGTPRHRRPHQPLQPRWASAVAEVPARRRAAAWIPSTPVAASLLTRPGIATLARIATDAALDQASGLGSALRKYQLFCNQLDIPPADQFPASGDTIHAFALWLTAPDAAQSRAHAEHALQFERVSTETALKYLADIRTWHIAHGQPVPLSAAAYERVTLDLKAFSRLGREEKMGLRPPVLIEHLHTISPLVDRTDPFESAAWAWTVIAFFSLGRGGEGTVPSRNAFQPHRHATFGRARYDKDGQGRRCLVIPLPSAKTSAILPDQALHVSWQKSPGIDPLAAFAHHTTINTPDANAHVFAWRDRRDRLRPLTASSWIACVRGWYRRAGTPRDDITGHCFRIGGATYWLAQGKDEAFVRMLGRWSSLAFQMYIRGFHLIGTQHFWGTA